VHRSQTVQKSLVALFFLALLLIGLATGMDYGTPWDETGEMNILRMALMEYAQLIPLDTPYSQALTAMQVQPISLSVERDHGICLYYPLFFAVCNPAMTPHALSALWRALTWLIFVAGAYALYALCRQMGLSRGMACLGVLMLTLSPRIFADAHYNNKDIALLSTVLLVLWQAVRLSQKPTLKRGLAFAAVAALCMGTRVIGVAVCGLCGLFIVLRLRLNRQTDWKVWRTALWTVLASVAFYALLTPALLSDPLGFTVYLLKNAIGFSRWHGTLLYWGNLISTAIERPPFHYLPVMIAITTPVWALALLLVGQVFAVGSIHRTKWKGLQQNEGFLVALATLLWLAPLLAAIFTRALVYNGWRHLYFIYGPMVLLMVYGWNRLWQKLPKRGQKQRIAALALTLCLGAQAVGIALNHPFEYAYYNLLVPRDGLSARFELDYWNVSCVNALQQLLAQAGPDETVRVAACDGNTESGLSMAAYTLNDARVQIVPYDEAQLSGTFVMVNITYAQIAGYRVPSGLRPVVTLTSYGVPITVIYEGDLS